MRSASTSMRPPARVAGTSGITVISYARLDRVLQIHSPALGVEVERERPLLAHAEARLLRASERQLIFDPRSGQVDRDESRLDAIDELMNAREVVRYDGLRESESHAVG